ncbi:transporter [Polaribacter sp. Hel_I_88]|uniref:transporter n=1 Tax=Polaribacter sp. Hel_I_88 TaxID=1250006 RepID=UPI00047B6592|nr:transporter [Polaribacter sp. Hel_I_88]
MKNHSLQLFIVCLFFGFSAVYGQYTEVINSNKPGFSESPYSVGTGVYQFESSLFFRNMTVKPTFSRPQSLGFDMLFRTSFFLERLELNLQTSYQKDKIAFKNIFTSDYAVNGFGRFTVGAKYLVYQQEYDDKSKEIRSWKRKMAFDYKRLIPSVAIYAGLNTDMVNDIYKTGSMSPKFGLLLQNNLSSDFNIVTNVFYDKIGTDFSEISYIITGTFNFNDYWSGFVENQTVFLENQNNINIGAGLAYLYSKNLQINASGRLLMEGNTQGFYGGFGVSYRIDKHKDSYKEIDENGREINSPVSEYNKKQGSFFSRLFSVFKKKEGKNSTRKKRKRN